MDIDRGTGGGKAGLGTPSIGLIIQMFWSSLRRWFDVGSMRLHEGEPWPMREGGYCVFTEGIAYV